MLKWLQNLLNFHLILILPCRWGFVFIYGVTPQVTKVTDTALK